jgi:hypothetical protein
VHYLAFSFFNSKTPNIPSQNCEIFKGIHREENMEKMDYALRNATGGKEEFPPPSHPRFHEHRKAASAMHH